METATCVIARLIAVIFVSGAPNDCGIDSLQLVSTACFTDAWIQEERVGPAPTRLPCESRNKTLQHIEVGNHIFLEFSNCRCFSFGPKHPERGSLFGDLITHPYGLLPAHHLKCTGCGLIQHLKGLMDGDEVLV
ncbi:hypothetical protein ACFX2J_008304 [Malus domestica]